MLSWPFALDTAAAKAADLAATAAGKGAALVGAPSGGTLADIVGQLGGSAMAGSLVELANLPVTCRPFLFSGGRSGFFQWVAGDQSANLAIDARNGLYVPRSTDTTPGASGAWKRVWEGPVLPEWFGALGDNATNDTAAFEAAFAVGFPVQMGAKIYRVKDLAVPSNATLRGIRGKSWLYRSSGATHILNVNSGSKIVLEDFGMHGVGRNAAGVSSGADGMKIRGVRFQETKMGLGSLDPATGLQDGYTGTTDIVDCEFIYCQIGIGNLVDSHVIGGRVTGCLGNGISWGEGANANELAGTRIEFNQGCGVKIIGAVSNVLNFGTVDRNFVNGIHLYNCDDTTVTGVFMRNGKDLVTQANYDRCHVYAEACRGTKVDIQTQVGNEDNKTGDITPLYSVRIGGGAGSMTGFTLLGGIEGCTGSVALQEQTSGAIAPDAIMLATGLEEKRMGNWRSRYGRSYQSRQTVGLAPGASAQRATFTGATVDASSQRSGSILFAIRNRATGNRSQTRVPFVVWRDGGNAQITLGTPVQEVGIDHIGGGTLSIAAASVTSGASSIFIDLSNNSATVTYDLTIEVV